MVNSYFGDSYWLRGRLPELKCPSCDNGILIAQDITIRDTAETNSIREEDFFDFEMTTSVFNGLLECNLPRCREFVVIVGDVTYDIEYSHDYGGGTTQDAVTELKPKYFVPSLKLIDLPDYIPEPIRESLEASFSLFFCDSDACGNKIRASIELLLNQLGVPQYKEVTGGQRFIALNARINSLSGEYDNLKELLSAIRIIGNEGSHSESSLTKANVIEAYTVVQFALDLAFKPEQDTARVYQIAQQWIDREQASR
jgi:hypothetical protein